MQNFPFFEKQMRIQFARSKSDFIAKMDGTFVEKLYKKGDKRKSELPPQTSEETKKAKRLAEQQQQQQQQVQRPVHLSGSHEPNAILFIQNLPDQSNTETLQVLFQQYPGFKDARLVEGKPGIAFVEYESEVESSAAMAGLQGFKVDGTYEMAISYAKK